MNMPPVTVGHVLGPIGVNKTLHVDHGVCQGVVQLLSEDNFASNRVCEGGYRSHHLLDTEMNTNQTGLLKSLDILEGGQKWAQVLTGLSFNLKTANPEGYAVAGWHNRVNK